MAKFPDLVETLNGDGDFRSFLLALRNAFTHRFPVADFRAGFEAMLSGRSGKVVLDWR